MGKYLEWGRYFEYGGIGMSSAGQDISGRKVVRLKSKAG